MNWNYGLRSFLSHSLYSHGIMCRTVWLRSLVLLCLWHVRRAWQKQSCAKISSPALRAVVLQEMGSVMYDREGPRGLDAKPWAMLKIMHLTKKYPLAMEFWRYVEEQWLFRAYMWVVGYRKLPYAGQDTNAAIEGYHSTLKATLKSGKCCMVGHRVDWLIHELTGEVLTHFWYQCLRKRFGFVINKRHEYIVIGALLKARNIPDIHVTLPIHDGAPATMKSCTKLDVLYTVFNPGSEWACYTCSQANRGYICKHKLKFLRMMKPDVEEGSIARLCGSLKGTMHGGVEKVFSQTPNCSKPDGQMSGSFGAEAPEAELDEPMVMENMEDEVWKIVHKLVQDAEGNDVLLRHLLAGVQLLKGTQLKLTLDMERGVLHPS